MALSGITSIPISNGSASIKKALPTLVPNQTYKTLNIQTGTEAPTRYLEMLNPNTPRKEKEKTAKELKEYCHLDTMAMVEILKFLETMKY